jgi:predicted lipoprotein with Yx(FWY)xxD motif
MITINGTPGPRALRRSLVGAMTLAVALGALAAGPVSAQGAEPVALATSTDALGTYLTGKDGMTLYFLTKDVFAGSSACYGPCAENWPPVLTADGAAVTAGDGVTGVIGQAARTDGTYQVTYDGRPLYTWVNDAAAGDTTGQGVGGVWFVAMADGSTPANPPAITLATATSDLGTFLTGKDGMTLYFFTKDTAPGVSVCEGDCAAAWPPVTVPAGSWPAAGEGVTGVVGVAPRSDGTWQVTYDGRPLYTFAGDTAAGDTAGQGVGDVWYVANVDGSVPAE